KAAWLRPQQDVEFIACLRGIDRIAAKVRAACAKPSRIHAQGVRLDLQLPGKAGQQPKRADKQAAAMDADLIRAVRKTEVARVPVAGGVAHAAGDTIALAAMPCASCLRQHRSGGL